MSKNNDSNKVKLAGTLSRDPKAGTSEKGSWAFFSVQPDGETGYVSCSAYGEAADAVAELKEGDTIELVGRVGSQKDKMLTKAAKKDVWVHIVVADPERGGSVTKSEPF